MLEVIFESLQEVNSSDQVKSLILNIGSVPLTKIELMAKVGLVHFPTFRKNYLLPALEMSLLEQTIPDSPNHPKLKYRLTEKGKKFKKNLS